MLNLLFFSIGLVIVSYGIYINTKTQVNLRKQLIKKYLGFYVAGIILVKFMLIPVFSLIKSLIS